jgi:small subunit ribosomal protein S8e
LPHIKALRYATLLVLLTNITDTFLKGLVFLRRRTMVVIQKRSQRKPSGARYKNAASKRLHQRGGVPAHTTIGKTRTTAQRTKGGGNKNSVLRTTFVNVYDGKKYVQAELQAVLENTANRHFIRRNIITQGCVVNTSIGKVKITNRPGQEGSLNGIKVE